MPSTPSTRDRIELQAAGENLNTWGSPKLNAALQRVEEAKDGRFAKTLTGDYTLVSSNYVADEARMAFLDFSGVGATITIPGVEKTYLVRNATSGDLVITTGSGVALTLHTGTTAVVAVDGTNVRSIGADADDLAATLAAAKAYTDAASLASGSLPASSGLSDEFLATGPTGGGSSGVPAWVTASVARSKMGLGTAAEVNTGTSGATVPLLNASVQWSGSIQLTGGGVFVGNLQGNADTATTAGSATSATSASSATTAGTCTGNAATATTAAACTGNAATATALTSGSKTVTGDLTVTGQANIANDVNFNLHKAVGVYALNMGSGNGFTFDPGSGRLSVFVGGVVVGYFDSTGYVNAV
jgi:hypothetical protein